ncbi:MAG: spore protease YyaC [Velocimicrobium sp.]
MDETTLKTCTPLYYNPKDRSAIYEFCHSLKDFLKKPKDKEQEIILVCIGSDRATGDCLGPLVGYKLSKLCYPNLHIYGTLASPVHAKNLSLILSKISGSYDNPFVIAVDASLGTASHVGYVTLGEGALSPGIGVDKELPSVGDIHITGIVNLSGMLNHMLLQTTRLDQVMSLADFICVGMRYAFSLS